MLPRSYGSWEHNKWGLVFFTVAHPQRPFALRAFAYGKPAPDGTPISVYRIADKHLHSF